MTVLTNNVISMLLCDLPLRLSHQERKNIKHDVQTDCVSVLDGLHLKPPLSNRCRHVHNFSTAHTDPPSFDLPPRSINDGIATPLRQIQPKSPYLSNLRISTQRRGPKTRRWSNVRVIFVRITPTRCSVASSNNPLDSKYHHRQALTRYFLSPQQRPALHRQPNNLLLINNTRPGKPQNRKSLLRSLQSLHSRRPIEINHSGRSKVARRFA